MEHPDYNSPIALKAFLDANGMAMQKKFGQNFLVNASARRVLADALGVSAGVSVWEVGPGLGAMTAELLSRGASVTAFEIDYGFSRLLRSFFGDTERFTLVEGDFLRTWRGVLADGALPGRFIGNLPYNAAAVMLADLIAGGARFDRAVVTVQKEVGQRICARPATVGYSSLSVLCQWAYDVRTLIDLAGGSFWPRPNVESRALVLERRADFPRCKNPTLFMRLSRALFASRRKTVRNNLLPLLPRGVSAEAVLSDCGVAPTERAEHLDIPALLALSDSLDSAILASES